LDVVVDLDRSGARPVAVLPVLLDGGVERRWSTVGLYQVRAGRVAACWLPLDASTFDDVWADAS
jgi:hypothetical protein